MYSVNGLKVGLPEEVLAELPGWTKMEVPDWYSAEGLYLLEIPEDADVDSELCCAYLHDSAIQKIFGRTLEVDGSIVLSRGDSSERVFIVLNSLPPEWFDPKEETASVFFPEISLAISFRSGLVESFMLAEPRKLYGARELRFPLDVCVHEALSTVDLESLRNEADPSVWAEELANELASRGALDYDTSRELIEFLRASKLQTLELIREIKLESGLVAGELVAKLLDGFYP